MNQETTYSELAIKPLPLPGQRVRVMLVYQAGLANVFRVDCFNLASFGRNAVRLMQSDFRTCESFARGMGEAGAIVRSAHCNKAGDIADSTWSENLDSAPFGDKFRPVFYCIGDGHSIARQQLRGLSASARYDAAVATLHAVGEVLDECERNAALVFGCNPDDEQTYRGETAEVNKRREARNRKRLSIARWSINRAMRELWAAQKADKKNGGPRKS